MAGIGLDIADVIEELGVEATVLRTPSNLVEKITYDVNGQASNPFMREFAVACSFRNTTVIDTGDYIQFMGTTYMVTHKTPDSFENEITEYASGLLKCNIVGRLLTFSEIKDPNTYEITRGWVDKVNPLYSLIYMNARSTLLNPEMSPGKETTFTLDCIVAKSVGITKGDRVEVSPTEYYRVQDVERYAYPGVDIASLVEDDRA